MVCNLGSDIGKLGLRLVMKHFSARGWPAGLFVVRRYITGLGDTLPPLFQGCVQVGFTARTLLTLPTPSAPRRALVPSERYGSGSGMTIDLFEEEVREELRT